MCPDLPTIPCECMRDSPRLSKLGKNPKHIPAEEVYPCRASRDSKRNAGLCEVMTHRICSTRTISTPPPSPPGPTRCPSKPHDTNDSAGGRGLTEELQPPVGRKRDVLRLEVTVDDEAPLHGPRMQVAQGCRELQRAVEGLLGRKLPVLLPSPASRRPRKPKPPKDRITPIESRAVRYLSPRTWTLARQRSGRVDILERSL